MTTPNSQNKLSQEKSPYLLQHKDNPVNWYAWSEEAFAKAREEGKPVFLSIGYSTCYWCHVMEKDSFEHDDVAEALNQNYIAIKVDREEFPDVDGLYMEAVMGMTGQGGWPLSVFLTPDREPFYGGTFFWKDSFKKLLHHVSEDWRNDQDRMLGFGKQVTQALRENESQNLAEKINPKIFEQTKAALKKGFDEKHGGFGRAPKFPHSFDLEFLYRIAKHNNDKDALNIFEKTLQAMACGGLYDHLGGGFHRYSTDERWFAPHFEKMLYDNALLIPLYAKAYELTQNEFYADVARQCVDYVLRDMTDAHGGFSSAEDAGPVNREGEFYTWTFSAWSEALDDNSELQNIFNVTEEGNWEHGQNILHVADENAWQKKSGSKDDIQKLFEAREKRERPHLDDKILTSWNGLMIAALSFASRVLKDEAALKAAQKAAEFLSQNLFQDGKVLRRYRDGEAKFLGTLEDYSFFVYGLLELYQVDQNQEWLELAKKIQDTQNENFWDDERGGYFYSSKSDQEILINRKTFYDGAVPSGNSIALKNLMVLKDITGENIYDEKIEKLSQAITNQALQGNGLGCSLGLSFVFDLLFSDKQMCQLGDDGQIYCT